MNKEYLEGLVGAEAAADIWQRHQQALRRLEGRHALSMAVQAAGGRSEKAICALLDQDAVFAAEDMAAEARRAVAQLKREQAFLFAAPQVTSPGTGSLVLNTDYSMADIGRMSMEEYRRYRKRG